MLLKFRIIAKSVYMHIYLLCLLAAYVIKSYLRNKINIVKYRLIFEFLVLKIYFIHYIVIYIKFMLIYCKINTRNTLQETNV